MVNALLSVQICPLVVGVIRNLPCIRVHILSHGVQTAAAHVEFKSVYGFLRREIDAVEKVGLCLNGKVLTVAPTPDGVFRQKDMCLTPWWEMRLEEGNDAWVWCDVRGRRRLKLDEDALIQAVEDITQAQQRHTQHVQLILTESAVVADVISKLDELLVKYKMDGREYDATRVEVLAVGKETKRVCEEVNALKKQDEPRSWMMVTGDN
eukprot:COSAG02_NODE_17893_length_973_cov_1.009153_1_plen_207_part_10